MSLLSQYWLQLQIAISLSFHPIRDNSYHRLFGHLIYLQEAHVPWQFEERVAFYAKHIAPLPDSSDSRSSPQEERYQRHSYSNTTWQPSESLPFIIMVPANSFKDISKVLLMADFWSHSRKKAGLNYHGDYTLKFLVHIETQWCAKQNCYFPAIITPLNATLD